MLFLVISVSCAWCLFDEEFEALKQRITNLELAAKEDKNENELLKKEVVDLKIKVSNLVYKDNNEESLTEVRVIIINHNVNDRKCLIVGFLKKGTSGCYEQIRIANDWSHL